MRETTFISGGVECGAWHLEAGAGALGGPAGRPCVVMAHGFGGTRDTALLPYAEGFAEAGCDVLVFDYRGFGASGGTPRQGVSHRRQRDDYRSAIAAARRIDGVDPDQIILWGTSYSGGHVVVIAAEDDRIAAVVSLTPATDGRAALRAIAQEGGAQRLGLLTLNGVRDALRAATHRSPHMVPVAGPAGSNAIIAKDGAEEAYTALAGPTWRNEVCARAALGVAFNRPVRHAGRLNCPLLIQIGDRDTVAPPAAARRTAALAGEKAEVCHYPLDHFDVYRGPWQKRLLADQLLFLRRHLAARPMLDNERVGV